MLRLIRNNMVMHKSPAFWLSAGKHKKINLLCLLYKSLYCSAPPCSLKPFLSLISATAFGCSCFLFLEPRGRAMEKRFLNFERLVGTKLNMPSKTSLSSPGRTAYSLCLLASLNWNRNFFSLVVNIHHV